MKRALLGDDEKDREGRPHVVPQNLSSFAARLGRAVFRYSLQLVLDFFKRAFFQTGDLCLGNMDLIRHFHLCFSFKKAEVDNEVFAF